MRTMLTGNERALQGAPAQDHRAGMRVSLVALAEHTSKRFGCFPTRTFKAAERRACACTQPSPCMSCLQHTAHPQEVALVYIGWQAGVLVHITVLMQLTRPLHHQARHVCKACSHVSSAYHLTLNKAILRLAVILEVVGMHNVFLGFVRATLGFPHMPVFLQP